jgi:prevent-host-death family protein
MEVSITQFRRELFELVGLAMKGEPVFITHKGKRFRIVPENQPADRFNRITALQVVNPQAGDLDDAAMKKEISQAIEKDWADL